GRAIILVVAVGAVLPLAAPAQAKKPVSVTITSPRDGATVSGPVTIKLQATGVKIGPATVQQPGTAHHHLFVDHDLTWLRDTIPSGSPGIIHLGRGPTEFV